MSDQVIRNALYAHLATLSFTPITGTPALQFAWAGDAYEPVRGTPYIRAYYLSVDDIPITTNPIQTRSERLFNVQCWVDEREGEDEAWRLADAVSAHFFPATGTTNELTAGSLIIQLNRRPSPEPLIARKGFVGVAVPIECFALI